MAILVFLIVVAFIWNLPRLLEDRNLWTLRFIISFYAPPIITILSLYPINLFGSFRSFRSAKLVPEIKASFGLGLLGLGDIQNHVTTVTESIDQTIDQNLKIAMAMLRLLYLAVMIPYLLSVWRSHSYIRLRWKAWTGSHRSNIPSPYSRLLSKDIDWNLAFGISGHISLHPVEVYPSFTTLHATGRVGAHPADILRIVSKSSIKDEVDGRSTPDQVPGIFAGASSDERLSLLWDETLGFRRRCSREIMWVAKSLLTRRPTMDSGNDGRAICLTYGILARNKGPDPEKLVCNLITPSAIRVFEENCVQWPCSTEALRSIYQAEFKRTFARYGEAYIAAATQLALLIADTSNDVLEDWLDYTMEQQSLYLNQKMARLGASAKDLDRVYRGQYAAMLVSLAAHRKGCKIRPEILVYDALCKKEDVGCLSSRWILHQDILEWRAMEKKQLGRTWKKLISAVIGVI